MLPACSVRFLADSSTVMWRQGDRYRGIVERQLQESETLMRSGREEYRRWLQQWRSSAVQQALIALHPDTSSWATVTLGRTA